MFLFCYVKGNACSAFAILSPAHNRHIFAPFGLGPAAHAITQAMPMPVARLDRGATHWLKCKRSLVRSPTCQAVYRWRLLRVIDLSGNCLLLGAAPWSSQTARETPLCLRLKSHHHSNACLASSCTSFCVLVQTLSSKLIATQPETTTESKDSSV